MNKTIIKSILIALFCVLSSTECNGIHSERYIIELPQGYEPIEIKTPYKESTKWIIIDRKLKTKYWKGARL
jgi:hypothetical protein